MVQFFGTVERSVVEDDQQTTVFRIPAVSKTGARQRAKGNARVKGLNNFSIKSVEQAGKGDLPGVKLYDVVVTSDR